MNKALMQIVVDTLVFLESSDEDTVEPRAAGKQLEAIAFHLKTLTPQELRSFLAFVDEEVRKAAQNGDPDGRGGFLRSLPEALGLV